MSRSIMIGKARLVLAGGRLALQATRAAGLADGRLLARAGGCVLEASTTDTTGDRGTKRRRFQVA
jgi:hypothetical protein